MRMLAGRTGASGWLRGRRGPRGPGRRRPAGDTCRKRRGDVKPPESRPRAVRKAPPKGGPSVSGAARKGGAETGSPRPYGDPQGCRPSRKSPRPQFLPVGKPNHIPVSIKRPSCDRTREIPTLAAILFPQRRPRPRCRLKKTFTSQVRARSAAPGAGAAPRAARARANRRRHPAAFRWPDLPDADPERRPRHESGRALFARGKPADLPMHHEKFLRRTEVRERLAPSCGVSG